MSVLTVNDIHKSFKQGDSTIHILGGVNFEVGTGESTAIVGQSGSGKTTLLTIIGGLDNPDQGSVQMDGKDLGQLNEAQLAQFRGEKVGIIFQQFHLVPHLTALENVVLPLDILGGLSDEEKEKKAAELLEKVGLGHRLHHRPKLLSGGEKQRVAIARALVHDPILVLADEPSGNLDAETGEKVMDLLFSLIDQNDLSLVLVTHDLELASKCSVQIQLKSGQVHVIKSNKHESHSE